jgi:hypothetical protein
MTGTTFDYPALADWCELNLGRIVEREGEQGTLSGYSSADGYCWVTVELDDGTTAEWLAQDLADVR